MEDAAAITQVIACETDRFYARDFDGWAACFVTQPRLRAVYMGHDLGLDVREGWDDLVAGLRDHFEEPGPSDTIWSQHDLTLDITGASAWATFVARTSDPACPFDESYETRILERTGEGWKIVYLSVLARRAAGQKDARLALDANGYVVAPTPRALQRLADHPAFELRQGRLVARDPAVNAGLQQAISRGGAVQGLFEQARFAVDAGQRFAHPIVLPNDAGGHDVLLMTVEDRLTYLDFGRPEDIAARVDVSAAIFALSEGQARVAHGIVEGLGLNGTAKRLGITPATAKTHLQRIFQKTGTSTQPALVRCLLSQG